MEDRREFLLTALIAFVCERTGLSAVQVREVFDADYEFWSHHQSDLWVLMHEEDPGRGI